MSGFLNQTFDDRDSRFLYQGSWSTGVGTWNASNVGQSGTLASTNDPNGNVTFTFPVPAIAFYYYGILRSHGGSYGICVDCDPNNRVFIPVDGFNATDDGKNPPVVVYSQTFSTPGVHEIIIRNQADPRGTPPGNSQLTLDRIDLEVVNTNPAATVTLSSTPPSTPTNTGDNTASTAKHSSSPVGIIVGVVLGVLALLIGIGILVYWLRLRKKYARAGTANSDSPADMQQQHYSTSELPYARPSTTLTHPGSQWGYGSGSNPSYGTAKTQQRPMHQPMMPSVTSIATATSSQLLSSSTSGASSAPMPAQRRREQDAGPLPMDEEEEEGETLPPEYGQVFSVGRRGSRRSGRRTLPPPPPQPGKVPLGPTVEEGLGTGRSLRDDAS